MPFIDVPAHHLCVHLLLDGVPYAGLLLILLADARRDVFYVINPLEPATHPALPASVDPAVQDPDVRCAPYEPDKPTLVFLHAGCRGVAVFNAQLLDPRLRSKYNVVAFTRQYHGRTRFSGDKKKPHTLDDAAKASIAFLDIFCTRFGIKQYAVFAEGIQGCHVGTLLAIQRSNQVLSLILSSPGHLQIPGTPVEAGLIAMLDLLCQNKDGRGDGTGTIPEAALDENAVYCFSAVDGFKAADRKKAHNEAFQRRYGTGHSSVDLKHLFLAEAHRVAISASERAKVTCPVLILHGTRDTLVSPLAAAKEWQSGFVNAKGGAELKCISDGPHLLSFVDDNVVNRIILGFLSHTVCPDRFDRHIRCTAVIH
ncbi:hypothetical protein JCM8097_006563 [Rhodosporidiobolus ruineniae]